MIINLLDKKKIDKINSFIFILFIFASILTLPIVRTTGSSTYFWIYIIFLFIYSTYINRNINIKFIFIFIAFTTLFMINTLLVAEWEAVINKYILFVRYGILGMYFSMHIKDYKSIQNYWYYIGIVGFIICNIYLEYFRITNGYMVLGINLTYSFIGFCMYFYNKQNKNKVIVLVFMMISFVQILLFGNRSSILICLAIIIYYEFININKKNALTTILKLTLAFIIVVYIALNISNILTNINYAMQKLGIFSYSITKYVLTLQDGIEGIVSQSSGRDNIFILSKQIIIDSNFMPNGVTYFENISGIIYPHNLFLEIMIEFGIFGLVIFIITSLILLNKYIMYSKVNYDFKVLIAVIVIYSSIRLMLSDTYWKEQLFWCVIGLILFYKSENKKVQGNFNERNDIFDKCYCSNIRN